MNYFLVHTGGYREALVVITEFASVAIAYLITQHIIKNERR